MRQRRHDLFFVLALLVRWLALRLPRPLGLSLFGTLGALAAILAKRDRCRAEANLRSVYGDWTDARIRRVARSVFVNLARNLFDAVRIAHMKADEADRVIVCDNIETLLEAHRAGRGPIAITQHLGCFEMQLTYFTRRGIRGFAVGQRLFDRRIDRMVTDSRTGRNMEYIARDANPREVVRRLLDGQSFGVLIDQDTNVDGVFAHFLGRLAYTPCGPVRLAMRLKIPLFVASTWRTEGDRHRIEIVGPVQLASGGSFDDDLVRNVETVNGILSDAIMRAPEQWVWMHRRWQRTPTDPRYVNVPNIERVG